MSTRINIDPAKYPILTITPLKEPTIEDIEKFLNEMEQILESRTGDFIIISDNSHNVNLPVNIRVNLGKSLNYLSSKYSSREKAVFVVINSSFGRIMFSCISLVARNNNLIAVSSLEEAETKARAILEKSSQNKVNHENTF